jgi:hypothetical protein
VLDHRKFCVLIASKAVPYALILNAKRTLMVHTCLLNLYIKQTEMDRDQMFVALNHMESPNVSSTGACEMYVETVAEIAEKVMK